MVFFGDTAVVVVYVISILKSEVDRLDRTLVTGSTMICDVSSTVSTAYSDALRSLVTGLPGDITCL